MSPFSIYYLVCLCLSILCSVLFMFRYNRQCPVQYSLLFLLLPIVETGYLMLSLSTELKEALLANKITYLGGCFAQVFVLFSILTLYRIEVRRSIQAALYTIGIILYGFVLTIGFTPSFYKSTKLIITEDGAVYLENQYAAVHVLFYLVVILYMFAGIVLLIFARFKRRTSVSTRTIDMFVIIEVISVLSFFCGRMLTRKIELIAFAYVVIQVFYLLILSYTSMYDIAANASALYEEKTTDGFLSFDRKKRYIGANAKALTIFPELEKIRIDSLLDSTGSESFSLINSWLDAVQNSQIPSEQEISMNDSVYRVSVNFLKRNEKKVGYFITLDDITAMRRYTHLMEDYSRRMNEEVTRKAESILEMQDRMVLNFADMIDNRDSVTGGHVRRMSEGVRLLVSKMNGERKDADIHFCTCVINAAPMHDIGKIAVPDTITQKPGRYELWEYEIMKMHAEKGAAMIRKGFMDYNDADLKRIAENIARYHHERWDGSGYPNGLAGTEIPLEARIVSIADVYDALVTKRSYKEAYSFEAAYEIIMGGMGTQFDPSLAKYFAACRKELESYYSTIGS